MLPAAMRRGVIAFGLAAGLSLASAPALADPPGRSVDATPDNAFFPGTITVLPGTTVTWQNQGGLHNVKFDDGRFEQPSNPQLTPWKVSRRFDRQGVFRYYCEMHGGRGGQGMSGKVVVEGNVGPKLTALTVKPRKVCNRRTRKCRRAKAMIRFKLSERAHVAGGIDPVGKPKGRRGVDLDMSGKKGRNSFRVPVRKLKPGRYRLFLAAEDANGNESDPARAYFRVKRARR